MTFHAMTEHPIHNRPVVIIHRYGNHSETASIYYSEYMEDVWDQRYAGDPTAGGWCYPEDLWKLCKEELGK